MFSAMLFDKIETYMLLVELVLGGLMVVCAGWKLTGYADKIADALGLGQAWIGMVLLATVTSLPELVTGVTAVTLDPPNSNIAFGNILGSNCFNVVIIVLLNAVMRQGSVLRDAQPTTTLAATFGIIMTALLVLAVAIAAKFPARAFLEPFEWCLAGVIVVAYPVQMRMLYRFEHRDREPPPADAPPAARPDGLTAIYARCAVAALTIVLAGYWMTRTGDVLATHEIHLPWRSTPLVLGGTFVGAFFLAIATSLPEIVTGVAAVRMGKLDLALGNLFGSNMFNVFVVPFLKGASWLGGSGLLMATEGLPDAEKFDVTRNTLTGGLAILLMGIAVASVLYRGRRQLYFFGFDSVLLAITYVGGMYLLLSAG